MPQPKLLSKPWASDGLKNNIPAERNGGLAQEAATYAEGFPSITMTPISVGGKPPSGKDMNGVLYEISAHTVWQNQGGRYRFDQSFCDAIGGYPKGSVLISDTLDTEYISLVDANTHNPNSGNNAGKWAIHAGKGLKASTTQAGIAQLSSATDSDREDIAATSKAVKIAYDKAEESAGKGLPVGAVIGFPSAITNPAGYLKADGSTFDQATYPDLYAALGNSNKLPDLRQHNIGMLAYFPTDTAPEGWLPCDGRTVSQAEYPELYAYLGSRYGAPGQLPDAQDRYIRNAGNGLSVGQKQKGSLGITDGHPSFSVSSLSYNGTNALSADEVAEMMGGDPLVPNYADYAFPDNTRPDNPGIVASWTSGTGEPVSSDGRVYSRTSGEVLLYGIRPKTIVFKLFIKAKDGAAEAAYWIRAYGAVSNTGSLDAAALAAGLQGKSDKGHTHTAAEITDLQAAVAAMTVNQRIGQFEVVKLPDGTLIQAGTVRVQNHLNSASARILTWPLTFAAAPVVAATVAGSRPDVRDALVTMDTAGSSQSALQYWIHEATYNTPDVTIHFIGIGRWRT